MDDMTGLIVDELSKAYGDNRAVDSSSLEVRPGQVVVLLGANGAGKSTLIRSVLGLERSHFRRVTIGGRMISAVRRERYKGVGYASQETAVNELLSVRENMRLWSRLRGMSGQESSERLDALAERFHLGHLADRRADSLSGGERRRVHVAAAFLDCDTLLILDEPTLGADFDSTDAILDEVGRAAGAGAAVLVTTHHLREVARLRAAVIPIVSGRTRPQVAFDQFSADLEEFDDQIRKALR